VHEACADLFQKRGIAYVFRGTEDYILKNRPLAFFASASETGILRSFP
jgi:hypothetical protein